MKIEYYYLSVIIFLITIAFVIIIFLIVRKNEKKKKIFIKNMEVGDTCRIATVSGTDLLNECEIVEIFDDKVTIELTISKRWIYPSEKK